jgi:hypothetical protein
VKVQKSNCNQCLFSNNRIVSTKRAEQIIKKCMKDDTFFVCHKSSLASKDGHGDVCCKGFFDNFGERINLGRIAMRLNAVQYVEVK